MPTDILAIYSAYIDCLNRRAWDELPAFVHGRVTHNDRHLGIPGYRAMLERDVAAVPDLHFAVDLLVGDASSVGARLLFDCRPIGAFLGLDIAGRRIRFAENVFYRFEGALIRTVWSIIDRAAIEEQLR